MSPMKIFAGDQFQYMKVAKDPKRIVIDMSKFNLIFIIKKKINNYYYNQDIYNDRRLALETTCSKTSVRLSILNSLSENLNAALPNSVVAFVMRTSIKTLSLECMGICRIYFEELRIKSSLMPSSRRRRVIPKWYLCSSARLVFVFESL